LHSKFLAFASKEVYRSRKMVMRYRVEDSAAIPASADVVYNIISDYNQHHGNIIPPHLFGSIDVVKGSGVGSGTRIACSFRILGQTGTLLIDSRAKNITQFLVKPISDDSCEVTIRTDVMREQGWLASAVEQTFTTILMKDWYKKELQQLSKYALSLKNH
jgi:hypothetical protein